MLAGGQGKGIIENALSSTYDGINWTTMGPVTTSSSGSYFPFFAHTINTFATNGTILVAGCNGGPNNGMSTLIYSYDGILWKVCKTGGINITSTSFMTNCNCIVFNPNSYNGLTNLNTGMFVATGSSPNSIAYSWDGINWTGRGISLFAIGRCIDYIGTYWIIGAFSFTTNCFAYSNDGINWTGMGNPIISPLTTASTTITGLASCRTNSLSGVKWVACGNGNAADRPTVMYSTDVAGTSWTAAYLGNVQSVSNAVIILANPLALSYNGSVWIVGGFAVSNSSISTSPDGITWTKISAMCGNIAWSGGIANDGAGNNWIAVGQNNATPLTTTNSNIIVSIDNGVTWTNRGLLNNASYSGVGSGILRTAGFFKNKFIIGSLWVAALNCDRSTMIASLSITNLTDPVSNPLVALVSTRGYAISGIATNGTNVVVTTTVQHNISTSTDKCITWITPSFGTTFFMNSVIWSSAFNRFITFPNGQNFIYTSPDGITWTVSTVSLASLITVSTGVRAMAASDPTGVTLNSGATGIIATVVFGGTSTTNVITISTNPLSTLSTDWLGKTNTFSGIVFSVINSIAWSPVLNIFVATGTSSTASMYIVTSSDNGVTWIAQNSAGLVSPGYSVCWSPQQNMFVVGGNGSMVWSNDGITWNNYTGSVVGAFSVIWNASLNKWFAYTSGGDHLPYLYTSLNGKNWVFETTPTKPPYNYTNLFSCLQVLPGF